MKERVFLSNNQDGVVENYWMVQFLNVTDVLTNRDNCSGSTFNLILFWRVLRDLRALLQDYMSIKLKSCRYTFYGCTNQGRNSISNGFKSDWMAVHIPIQYGFVQRLVLYKTIENSNIKINKKILFSNGKILIFARIQYHKVEGEIINVLHWQSTS